MGKIKQLDKGTIDQIAAGEVVERASSVVKELTENAIDAGATAITVEIRDGGKSLIRVTDNGTGIERDDVKAAFARHATSKMGNISDLFTLRTLGFRGEALSSIAAVSEVDLMTKTAKDVSGIRYSVYGGEEQGSEEIGAPDGTTVICRNLFYNTPARLKFLKSAKTEGAYVGDLLEKLALSNPHISFHLIRDGKDVLTTGGNGDLKEVIYRIYGREISENLIGADMEDKAHGIVVRGYLGKPVCNRANRAHETFFVNGRVVESKILRTALEEGYKHYLMQRRFPFAVLFFELPTDMVDINAHPAKKEVRFHEKEPLHDLIVQGVQDKLLQRELIPDAGEQEKKEASLQRKVPVPEPFESARTLKPYEWQKLDKGAFVSGTKAVSSGENADNAHRAERSTRPPVQGSPSVIKKDAGVRIEEATQLHIFDDVLLTPESRKEHHVIGQIFKTFWIMEFRDKMYLVDQHAAHEKVNYERMMKRFRARDMMSQLYNPPLIVTMTNAEEEVFRNFASSFKEIGFMVDPFGEHTYAIRGVPVELYGAGDEKELFLSILDELMEDKSIGRDPEVVTDRIATMACKASVKGNTDMSTREFDALIDELMTLENPYHCPHGRPTIISMTKAEIERRFQRIVS